MFDFHGLRHRWLRVSVIAALCTGLAVGCGKSDVGVTYPVNGQITMNGEPLNAASTVILFKPNAARGNASPYEPAGTVDAQGQYRLTTKGKGGAPPGWYKVVVTAVESRPEHAKSPQMKSVAKSLVPPKYGRAETTDLEIEVVESAFSGAYDLKLAK
jgi:hypothetical protein